jgi:hypothetical protein
MLKFAKAGVRRDFGKAVVQESSRRRARETKRSHPELIAYSCEEVPVV